MNNNNAITLPDPDRLRQTPQRFSWIDHRLLRGGHLQQLTTPHAAALYLVLLIVSDARGLSYYSDKRLLEFLPNTTSDQFAQSRRELIRTSLIAYRRPHYQVLSLDPGHIKTAQLRQNNDTQHDRSQQTLPIKDALQQLLRSLEKKASLE
jgi:hypothetical protein